MTVLWLNLFIVYAAALYARFVARPAAIHTYTAPAGIKPSKFMTAVVMLTFVLISGLRNNIGDTVFYIHTYTIQDFSWSYILSEKDIGFGVLQKLLKQFSSDPQLLIFVTALITNVLIVQVLYKYTRLFELSVYLYITSGLYIVSMNGIRQFLASAIVFAGIRFLFEGKWKAYFLVVLFASTIHQSALVLIPLYFIVRRKAWTLTTVTLLASAVLLVLGYNQLSDAFFSAISDTQYANYKNFDEGGANMIRVVIQAIPLVLAYLGREKLRELFPRIDYVVNMSVIGFVIMVVSTQNWIFARFIIYFGLYNLILMGWIVKIFPKNQQRLVYYAVLVFYFVYFFYENAITLKLVYRSDYLHW